MSTPPAPRRSVRVSSQAPLARSPSFSVEPKTEYLRHALEARRAKNATPAPPERTETPPVKEPSTGSSSSADPWLDEAHAAEDAPKPIPTPVRRRRPSEGALPRLRTQRELQAETDQLKDAMFNLNLKLELLKKQNNQLKDQMDEATKRIEELEPFEDENIDLRDDNNRLVLKMQDLEDEGFRLRDENMQLRDENATILQIQEESVGNMDKQHAALDEAAEIILELEGCKMTLADENALLAEQVASLRARVGEHQCDGESKDQCPTRVYSIDESRPSTSHFDSDYYSQPASPQVKPSRGSPARDYSERARQFLDMHSEGKKSMQDLQKRLSDASIRHSARPASPVPEVPRIPDVYQQVVQASTAKGINRITKRYREMRAPRINTAVAPAADASTPQTPTSQTLGLRGLFRDVIARDSRPSSSHAKSPADTRSPKASPASGLQSPRSAHSLLRRHARTSSSLGDAIRHDSKTDIQDRKQVECEVPPNTSIITDLAVDLDRKDRWWKSVDRLHQSATPASPPGSTRFRTPLASPYEEQNFLFNPNEDEDTFVKRAGYRPRRREK